MVLIAFLIVILCGMLGLAIDGGRAFVDRREIQNDADSAAMAGAVTYIHKPGNFVTAETAILDNYALNRGLTADTSRCSPSLAAPASGGTFTSTCTFSGDASQSLSLTVQDFAPPASFDEFSATGQHSLLTAIIQVAGTANSAAIAATGCAATYNTSACRAVPPVVLATNTLCGSGGDALTLTGASGTTPGVVGNVGSFGDVKFTGTPNVAGDTTWTCGDAPSENSQCYPAGGVNSSSGCSGSYQTGGFRQGKPPIYNIPECTSASCLGSTENFSGSAVNLSAGVFNTLSAKGGGVSSSGSVYFGGGLSSYSSPCYFLAPGVYSLNGVGAVVGSGIFSNELRPPDEPDETSTDKSVAIAKSREFWNQNGANCAGSFSVTAVADTVGIALPVGSYAFRLTSKRTSDNGIVRESAPSVCKTITIPLVGQGVQISVSNVPGAQDYEAYLSSTVLSTAANDGDTHAGTCSGFFYDIGAVPVQNYANETNVSVSACPSTVTNVNCTLGVSSQEADLCLIDRVEYKLGILGSVPAGCLTVENAMPTIAPQTSVSCSASAYVVVPPPADSLGNPPVAASCKWPGPMSFYEFLQPVDGNLPDQDPAVGYEIANWGACDTSSTQSTPLAQLPFCPNNYNSTTDTLGYDPSAVLTPGAVQLQADSGSGDCWNFSGGYPFLFSGYQYSWGLVMHSGSSGCSDNLSPANGGQFIGHYYGPSSAVTVTATTTDVPVKGPEAATVYGCVIASQPTINSGSGIAVYFVTPTTSIEITGYGIPIGSQC